MSARSIKRNQQRRIAAQQRRETLKMRRAVLTAGATVGAFALGPAVAQAADYEVTTLGDGPVAACAGTSCTTLRDAIAAAKAAGGDDAIHFQAALTGTIALTMAEGELVSGPDTDDLTIHGEGITVNGDNDNNGFDAGDSRVLNATNTGQLTVTGMTMTEGYSTTPDGGGALLVGTSSRVALDNVQITNSYAKGGGGGAIGATNPPCCPNPSELEVIDSQITGNKTNASGGAISGKYVSVDGSTISGNMTTGGPGGAIVQRPKYSVDVSDSTISGNTAGLGGGISTALGDEKYTALEISNTTITDNTATNRGGGINVFSINNGNRLSIDHSTVSGNHATGAAIGGGIYFGDTVQGHFEAVDSTISGNDAPIGAGVGVQSAGGNPQIGENGSMEFNNSTIAANVAATTGGGVYLGDYMVDTATVSGTPELNSTVVADNTASGGPQDLDRSNASTAGGFDTGFSLVEAPGDAALTQSAASIIGVDPQLGGLANNGGPTMTHMPSGTSPLIDKGWAPFKLTTDQRGQPRTIDLGDPNAARGDGTDIGSVERSSSAFVPASSSAAATTPTTAKKCKKKKRKGRSAATAKKKKKTCKKKKKKK